MDKKLLRDAFNATDPLGVFFEDNVDEYDPEIDDLFKMSVDFSDVIELKRVLSEIFHRWFKGIDISEEKIGELAGRISNVENNTYAY